MSVSAVSFPPWMLRMREYHWFGSAQARHSGCVASPRLHPPVDGFSPKSLQSAAIHNRNGAEAPGLSRGDKFARNTPTDVEIPTSNQANCVRPVGRLSTSPDARDSTLLTDTSSVAQHTALVLCHAYSQAYEFTRRQLMGRHMAVRMRSAQRDFCGSM